MNIKYLLVAALFSATLLSALSYTVFAAPEEHSQNEQASGDPLGPSEDTNGYQKFDEGFYEKILSLESARVKRGADSVAQYYDVIFVVERGNDSNSNDMADENKQALAKRLNLIGARDIRMAESLSFVTASVPIDRIIGFSSNEKIFSIGDGEIEVVSEVDTARQTIHATPSEIRTASGDALDGTGVIVGVIDTGINHPVALNDKVLKRVMCTNHGCSDANISDVHVPREHIFPYTTTSHGTRVAQVLAASGLPAHNGIAPGVELLDIIYGIPLESSGIAHALDWALTNGADVVNLSFFMKEFLIENICSTLDIHLTHNVIINEAVDKGMVAVKSAGNDGWNKDKSKPAYSSITSPGCSHNIISAGGIDDRGHDYQMYVDASRGPVTDTNPRLKPDLVAPAYNIQTLSYVDNTTTNDQGQPINVDDTSTYPTSGTSYAAPQVSATAAMLLQARPDLTPVEIKAAILLGANFTGPVPCTSVMYEVNDATDNCSYARQPLDRDEANNSSSLEILNNVGLGILDVAQTLRYASERTLSNNHVVGDYVDSDSPTKRYSFQAGDTSEPVKVILTWMAHPHGSIADQGNRTFPTVNIADLGFTVTAPDGTVTSANSEYQSNEFAVFMPSNTGTYTIEVTGSDLDSINKPLQNYAIASTHSLELLPAPFANTPPTAQARTVTINPASTEPAIVRLEGSDQNNDPISFHVSRDPLHGVTSTAEMITSTSSRMSYTPNADFTVSDSFEVTPQDGLVTGRSAIITLLAETLPAGSSDVPLHDSSGVRSWDTLAMSSGLLHKEYSHSFAGPNYRVSSIYLGSVNMEGVDAQISTSGGNTYTAAIPPSGTRMIEFSSPIMISSATLSADGLDEENAYEANRKKSGIDWLSHAIGDLFKSHDTRMFIGYVPASAGQPSLLDSLYRAVSSAIFGISDDTGSQDTSSEIHIPIAGTIKSLSVSVEITHSYIGDLLVNLVSPAGTVIPLHEKSGGSAKKLRETYSSESHTALATLLDSDARGTWKLTVGDYAGGDTGTLDGWELGIKYSGSTSAITNPNPPPSASAHILFSDDFEDSLAKWTESGDGDWTISTSQSHSVPTIPAHPSSNSVLHSDDCDISCTLELKNPIDLSASKSATLSFWRFVDSGLDRDEYLKVQAFDGSSWNTIFHWSDNLGGDDSAWHKESFDLSSYLGTADFKIRLVTQQSYYTEDVQLDDILITATASGGTVAPQAPTAYSVYVADTDDYEILAYASDGTYLGDIVPRKSGGLGKPWDVAFGPDGSMYVSDNTYNKIRRYSGSDGSAMGRTSSTAEWASTTGYPNGLTWHNNALYVATSYGIEKISPAGAHLGYFGDASRSPSSSGAEALLSAYDVAFCPDSMMYVADRALGRILYYDANTGRYAGMVPDTPASTQPDMRRAAGLECGPAIAGTGTSLYQSGDDGGRINEINYSNKRLVREFTSMIDEPYGMDSDVLGNLYVANKDDDNILRVSPSGAIAEFAERLDDPRGVAVGPAYSHRTSEGSGTVPQAHNDSPEIAITTHDGAVPIMMDLSLRYEIAVAVSDADGDPVSIGIVPDMLPSGSVLIADYGNGTATITLDSSGMAPGSYTFTITASDGQNETVREPYGVIIR